MLETPSEDGSTPTAPPDPTPGTWRPDATAWRVGGILAAVVVLAVAAFGLAATSGAGDGVRVDALEGSASPLGSDGTTAGGTVIVVEVSGAVARPGVYRLAAGARVADAIEAAGGYGPRIDTTRSGGEVDLVAPIVDGAHVHVPSRDEAATAAPQDVEGNGAGSPLIDLNSATIDALDTLPGIGPVTAEKIIAAREEAPFAAVDDLRSRGVLGEKTFERIRDLVTVS